MGLGAHNRQAKTSQLKTTDKIFNLSVHNHTEKKLFYNTLPALIACKMSLSTEQVNPT